MKSKEQLDSEFLEALHLQVSQEDYIKEEYERTFICKVIAMLESKSLGNERGSQPGDINFVTYEEVKSACDLYLRKFYLEKHPLINEPGSILEWVKTSRGIKEDFEYYYGKLGVKAFGIIHFIAENIIEINEKTVLSLSVGYKEDMLVRAVREFKRMQIEKREEDDI